MGAAVSQALAALGLGAQPPAAWLAAAALGLVALGTLLWLRARPRRRRRLQQVGTVQQLYIYPVKSCKGVAVSEAECTALGLRRGHLRDRYAGPGRGAAGEGCGAPWFLTNNQGLRGDPLSSPKSRPPGRGRWASGWLSHWSVSRREP